ncbi:MAG TPA: hypothetical protein VIJ75_21030 [Hanamia sp.]
MTIGQLSHGLLNSYEAMQVRIVKWDSKLTRGIYHVEIANQTEVLK